MKLYKSLRTVLIFIIIIAFNSSAHSQSSNGIDQLESGFKNPPDSSRPGVYWYFMDGNLSKKGMTKDLEYMKKAGIGSVIFLEVNVGVPRGKIDFFSEEWKEHFIHAVEECERLGIEMTLGVGPGWTGSGGPWVNANESMRHLVSSSIEVTSSDNNIKLPIPTPKNPYFGEGVFTPALKKEWLDYYEDVTVLAFPTPEKNKKIQDVDEKALYYRAPYTSVKGVKQFLPSLSNYPELKESVVLQKDILDLSEYLSSDSKLNWNPPAGKWTIMRFGMRNNGAITRPAPEPGLGFESDKFDTLAIKNHLDVYVGELLNKIENLDSKSSGGLKMLHMDSWEMGAQNWTSKFREEFEDRRGYDPQPFYPVYAGTIVGSVEKSERFLWDLRQTSQELILENHAGFIKKYAHKYGLGLSIEPYDMNPTSDMELGNIADVVMAEFWSKGFGYNSGFSVIEASSVANINGQKILPAEAFTSSGQEGYRQYPGVMKNQTDWAFGHGISKLMFHTFQHQPLDDSLKPGMTMGPYGVHWHRNQTWWPMVDSYHKYVSRVQYILQKFRTSADILYLAPEGSPHVFRAPESALKGDSFLPDKKNYNFDGCAPSQLLTATVEAGKIVFPSGATYSLLVLPYSPTMTVSQLEKIQELIYAGAIVVGIPPQKSPSLVNYPKNDEKIQEITQEIWGDTNTPKTEIYKTVGKGKIIWGGTLRKPENDTTLYPEHETIAQILKGMHIPEDFHSDEEIRYIHKLSKDFDIYFVSNKSGDSLTTQSTFRTAKGAPQLWNPIDGKTRFLPEYSQTSSTTTIPMVFGPYESFLVVFKKGMKGNKNELLNENFPESEKVMDITGSWDVFFDPQFGGPGKIKFEELIDWSKSKVEGIKHYSGIATYKKAFRIKKEVLTKGSKQRFYIDLGQVSNMARVKINGIQAGVVWTQNRLDITEYLKPGKNNLEIDVANLWINRLIGDEKFKDDQSSKRSTYTTYKYYNQNDTLEESGLVGPVKIYTNKY